MLWGRIRGYGKHNWGCLSWDMDSGSCPTINICQMSSETSAKLLRTIPKQREIMTLEEPREIQYDWSWRKERRTGKTNHYIMLFYIFTTPLNMYFLASNMSDVSQIVFPICYTLKLVDLHIDYKEKQCIKKSQIN